MSIKNDTAGYGEPSKPRLLSIKQAVYELGISRTAVYELIAARKIMTVKVGRRRLIPSDAIENFIAGLGSA
jgi:excisionase family DNA binding protein